MHQYFVYIMTNNLERRIFEHKNSLIAGFTKKYKINRSVYYEETNDILAAITREKQLKGWRRDKKIALIESSNLEWRDLSEDWD